MQIMLDGRPFNIPARAIGAIADGKKIVAIKIFRENIAPDLVMAKNLADRIEKILIDDGGVPSAILCSANESLVDWMQDVSRRLLSLETKYEEEKENGEEAKKGASSP